MVHGLPRKNNVFTLGNSFSVSPKVAQGAAAGRERHLGSRFPGIPCDMVSRKQRFLRPQGGPTAARPKPGTLSPWSSPPWCLQGCRAANGPPDRRIRTGGRPYSYFFYAVSQKWRLQGPLNCRARELTQHGPRFAAKKKQVYTWKFLFCSPEGCSRGRRRPRAAPWQPISRDTVRHG